MDTGQHIRLLGWLYVAHGAMMLVGAIVGLIASTLGGLFSGSFIETIMAPIIGVTILICLFVLSLPSFLAGKGLLEGKGWARVLAMIVGALSFFSFPLGTALCVYTFWVLWGQDADPYFEGRYPSYHERY